MFVLVPVLFERSQAAFLGPHRSLEFAIQPVHPRFVVARQSIRLFPAHFGDEVEMLLHLIEKSLAVIAFACHKNSLCSHISRPLQPYVPQVTCRSLYQYSFNASCIDRGEFN